MSFTEPLPFQEALDELASKGLLPTDLSTAELRELAPAIRQVSIFSARMNKASVVQRFRDLSRQILSPSNREPGETSVNIATARARMQDFLRSEGYDPEQGGFAGEAKVPPAERGSLRDLSSNPRLDLMLKTKVQQMAQTGYKVQQNTPTARKMYPCWELVRVGVLKGGPDAARDWPARWKQVGGSFYGGRMIAPKDDEIWAALGNSDNFDDALDTEIPPYAFNSHMTRRAVARALCISLGVIKPDFTPKAQGVNLAQTAQASAIPFSADFLADLKRDLGAEVEAGRIRLAANIDDASVRDALARWLTWRALAWNYGTSEGARKGWITRRAGAMASQRQATAAGPNAQEIDAYREHAAQGADRAASGAYFRGRMFDHAALALEAARVRGLSDHDLQADSFHGRRLRNFALNAREAAVDNDPATRAGNARAVAAAALAAHVPSHAPSPSADPAEIARAVDPRITTLASGNHVTFALSSPAGTDRLRLSQDGTRTLADATDAGQYGHGATLYKAAYTVARNTGQPYEAHGLTAENEIRGTTNQVQSTLDHGGETGHLLPEASIQGIQGWHDRPANLDEHRENLGAALLREKEHAFASHPMLRGYRMAGKQVVDLQGNRVPTSVIKNDINGADPQSAFFKVGIGTALRAIRTNTVLRRREAGER